MYVATAINCMLDHIHVMDQKMETMCKALKSLGSEVEDIEMPATPHRVWQAIQAAKHPPMSSRP